MAFDERLADLVRRTVGPREDASERKMFGGLAFLLDGKMFCGIVKDELMVRVGPERYQEALGRRHARPMDFTGRPMVGYVFVAPSGCRTVKAVGAWVEQSLEFASTLDAKAGRKGKRKHVGRRPH